MSSTGQPGFLHRFLQIASSHPDAVAIHQIDDGVRITYGALRAQAEATNGALGSLGVQAGARVLLLLPNGISLVVAYLAAIGRGAVPVLVNDKLTAHECATLAADALPTAVVTNTLLFAKHEATLATLPGLRAVVTVDDRPTSVAAHPFALACLNTMNPTPEPLMAPEDDSIVTIQYTYKGLGEPLPVAHRYRAFVASIDGLHEQIHPQGPGSTFLVALPLYAIFGLVALMIFPLSVGATMLMTNTILRRDIADLLSRYRVTLAVLVPDLIRFFTRQLAERRITLPALDPKLTIYSGGSYLSPDVARALGKQLGETPVLQGYGLTECLPIVLQSAIGPTKAGALGRPISNVQVRIVDDCGADVEPGRTGELIVRGPTVAAGYPGKAQATSRFFRDGWLHTGDLVRCDADGHLFFVGRRLRITKIMAQMVDLAEIESILALHPRVQRTRVRVICDAEGRNTLHVCVAGAADVTGKSVLAHLAAHLSSFKVPRTVELIPAEAELV